ncbi:energy transducer TonB [Hydrogenophaga sp.]|uniref:energy transducer TonB n=1 Tax=Hydrogenophaga sp. TaxID=1904254 RepID=UPI00351DD05B
MTAASASFAPFTSPMPLHAPRSPVQRRLLIVAAVLGFHVAGLWALQSGLLHRAVVQVMPVLVMADLIEAPQPEITPPPPAPPSEKVRPVSQAHKQTKPAPAPAPLPLATAHVSPPPDAPTGATEPDAAPPDLLAAVSEPAPAPPAPAAPPAPPRVELPSSSAEYLNNPRPPYPPLSKRLGEQGRVVVRVFIEANGTASKAEIRSSSGYDRLDQTALQTVLKWRYAPGKRNGVAEAMWFNVPISFVLE